MVLNTSQHLLCKQSFPLTFKLIFTKPDKYHTYNQDCPDDINRVWITRQIQKGGAFEKFVGNQVIMINFHLHNLTVSQTFKLLNWLF
ncbi:hypothetical protein FKM82_000259 [Ascaphus truei]